MRRPLYSAVFFLGFLLIPASSRPGPYPWPHAAEGETIHSRFQAPRGTARLSPPENSFGGWLQRLPLKSGRPPVRLYDGTLKNRQDVHAAVVDMPIGNRDLEQCADAVIRLRAEYLRAVGREADVCFRFTNGDPCPWPRWAGGDRPSVLGSRVAWFHRASTDTSRASFEDYLFTLFRWAGTLSLSRELAAVPAGGPPEIGDVYIQGGSPGHAVIVADAARARDGSTWVLLLQSYMPAQEIHVLKNADTGDPWFPAPADGSMNSPQWAFPAHSLKRFSEHGCP